MIKIIFSITLIFGIFILFLDLKPKYSDEKWVEFDRSELIYPRKERDTSDCEIVKSEKEDEKPDAENPYCLFATFSKESEIFQDFLTNFKSYTKKFSIENLDSNTDKDFCLQSFSHFGAYLTDLNAGRLDRFKNGEGSTCDFRKILLVINSPPEDEKMLKKWRDFILGYVEKGGRSEVFIEISIFLAIVLAHPVHSK